MKRGAMHVADRGHVSDTGHYLYLQNITPRYIEKRIFSVVNAIRAVVGEVFGLVPTSKQMQ
jgi:hypothetical protein